MAPTALSDANPAERATASAAMIDATLTGEQPFQFLEGLPSASFQETLRIARLYAGNAEVCISVLGPIGSGKTQLLSYIHARSPRRERPHAMLSLASVDEHLSLSALFGHVKGAYTGAHSSRPGVFKRAGAGTVSLDELGKCPLRVQQQLIEAFDPGVYTPLGSDEMQRRECRILVASNVAFDDLVDQGTLLDDLRSRIDGFPIRLASLADRREDIPAWAMWFAQRACAEWTHSAPPSFHPDLLRALENASLPYNLRDLKRIVQRLLIEAQGARVLTRAHCQRDLAHLVDGSRRLGDYRLSELEALLAEHDNRVSRVADRIGAHRASLHKQLKHLRAERAKKAS